MDASLRRALYKTIEDTLTSVNANQVRVMSFSTGFSVDIYFEIVINVGTDRTYKFLLSTDSDGNYLVTQMNFENVGVYNPDIDFALFNNGLYLRKKSDSNNFKTITTRKEIKYGVITNPSIVVDTTSITSTLWKRVKGSGNNQISELTVVGNLFVDNITSAGNSIVPNSLITTTNSSFSVSPILVIKNYNNATSYELSNADVIAGIDSTGSIKGNIFTSTIATGSAPLVVSSTTKVTNLNADLLDGLDTSSSDTTGNSVVTRSSGNFSAKNITATKFIGALEGNADTTTTSSENDANFTRYILFANSTSGSQSFKTDELLNFNPSTNNLSSGRFNNLVLNAAETGFTIAGGISSKTLTVSDSVTLAGTGTLTLNKDLTVANTFNFELEASGANRKLTLSGSSKTLAGTGTSLTINNSPTIAGTGALTLNKDLTVNTGNVILVGNSADTSSLTLPAGSLTLTAPLAGRIVYSTANSYALSSAGTTGQVLLSGQAGAPTWSSGTLTLNKNLTIANTFNFELEASGAARKLTLNNNLTLAGTTSTITLGSGSNPLTLATTGSTSLTFAALTSGIIGALAIGGILDKGIVYASGTIGQLEEVRNASSNTTKFLAQSNNNGNFSAPGFLFPFFESPIQLATTTSANASSIQSDNGLLLTLSQSMTNFRFIIVKYCTNTQDGAFLACGYQTVPETLWLTGEAVNFLLTKDVYDPNIPSDPSAAIHVRRISNEEIRIFGSSFSSFSIHGLGRVVDPA
jgi:hypothetical protein